MNTRPDMSAEEFSTIARALRGYAGLNFLDDQRYLLTRRLAPRLESCGLRSFAEYARLLLSNRREMEEAVDRVTVNETYFFREEYQLHAFADEIVPELALARRAGRSLSVWSAGCSTGEEAYTISMLLQERALCLDWDVRIVGTDISRRALRAASRGRYRLSAFRHTSPDRRRRFFSEEDGHYDVIESVRTPVVFARANLLDGGISDVVPEVDVIFCRNVLIYFDAPSRRRVIDSFYERLRPGGYLLLGHSENLLSLSTDFELVQLQNDTVYRRPRVAARKS